MNNDPPSAQDVHEAEGIIRTLTRGALQQIGDVTDLTLVGTAGTITALATMAQQLRLHDPKRIQKPEFFHL